MRENDLEGEANAETLAPDVGSNANMVTRTTDNLISVGDLVKRGGHHGKE